MRLDGLDKNATVCLGLSGGADSVALLLRCVAAGLKVAALHFNHGFADECGDEDEAYVRQLCDAHAIPLHIGRCTETWSTGETKEVFARRHRFAFFAQTLKALHCPTLLLAHHAGDRAENLVIRLARGCGLEGLTSFRWQTPFPGEPTLRIIRPLLDETHADQVRYLTTHHIAWREDVSNDDTSIPRNAIRHLLAPTLPHFTSGANATADVLEEEQDYLHRQTERILLEQDATTLHLSDVSEPVLTRRALRAWLACGLTRKQAEALCGLPCGKVLEVAGRVRVRRVSACRWERLLTPEVCPSPLRIDREGRYDFGQWTIEVKDAGEGLRLPLPLLVRGRQPGDKLRPAGFKGTKKVQDLFTEMKIPAALRDAYPLLFEETGRLLAVPGTRPAAIAPEVQRYTITITRNV